MWVTSCRTRSRPSTLTAALEGVSLIKLLVQSDPIRDYRLAPSSSRRTHIFFLRFERVSATPDLLFVNLEMNGNASTVQPTGKFWCRAILLGSEADTVLIGMDHSFLLRSKQSAAVSTCYNQLRDHQPTGTPSMRQFRSSLDPGLVCRGFVSAPSVYPEAVGHLSCSRAIRSGIRGRLGLLQDSCRPFVVYLTSDFLERHAAHIRSTSEQLDGREPKKQRREERAALGETAAHVDLIKPAGYGKDERFVGSKRTKEPSKEYFLRYTGVIALVWALGSF
nr:unnamed protein product [Haemonchus contortus]